MALLPQPCRGVTSMLNTCISECVECFSNSGNCSASQRSCSFSCATSDITAAQCVPKAIDIAPACQVWTQGVSCQIACTLCQAPSENELRIARLVDCRPADGVAVCLAGLLGGGLESNTTISLDTMSLNPYGLPVLFVGTATGTTEKSATATGTTPS